MPTMKNPETGETREMTKEEILEAMREGKVTIQQQVHHADGTVTSSTIYGNEIGDDMDRSMNVFGEMRDILIPAGIKAKKRKQEDENEQNVFYMDNSDVDYEVTIDDTVMPVMHIVTCTKERITVARYIRDERKTVGTPTQTLDIVFENGIIAATAEEVQENSLALFAFGVDELRRVLRERGILQELQKIGNKSSGVVITSHDEEIEARIVRGLARPDLPCLMFGGLFAQSMEDAVMMRPYVDELMTAAMYEEMSLEEKIAAAEDGDTDLMNQLAMYYLDECDEPDAEKATYWFEKMTQAGIPTAMFSLGLHYAKGFGVERDFEKATYWMQQAAENGDEDAGAIAEEYAKIAVTKEKADAGDAQAQADMVGHFTRIASSLDQAGEEADFELAFRYAQKSAAQNNGDGIWGLALCYEHGRGVDEDVDKAIELYRKGVEMDHAPSQHSLACYLMRGDYLDEDREAAFELCEKSAMQGYKLAEFSLAKMYELGMGCEENIEKAIEWGEKAATGGDANTQYEVAKLYTYTNEDDEMIDAERAKYWYSQAAEQGHEMAANVLAFDPMWGGENDWDADDWEDDVDGGFDEDEDDEVNEEWKEEARLLAAKIMEKDTGELRHLLMNLEKNCLLTMVQNAKLNQVSFEELCQQNYFLFDVNDIDWEQAKNCFIVVTKKEENGFFGNEVEYSFGVIYKMAHNDLIGYKNRALEVCSFINQMVNAEKSPNGELLHYSFFSSDIVNNEYGMMTVQFTDSSLYDDGGAKINVFADCAKDTKTIFETLFMNEELKEILGISQKSMEEAYDEGFFTVTENFVDYIERGHKSLVVVTWDLSSPSSFSVVPVARNKAQVRTMSSLIKKQLKKIPLENAIAVFSKDNSQENIELAEDLFGSILLFILDDM